MFRVDEFLECEDSRLEVMPEETARLFDQEPWPRRLHVDGRAVAAPPPFGCLLDEACLHGIAVDVGDRADEMGHVLDLHSSRSVPEEVVSSAMSAIRPARVISIELLETC